MHFPKRLSKRRSLLCALILGELLGLLAGGAWFGHLLEGSFRHLLGKQVLEDNSLIASQFGKLIEQMNLEQLEIGTPEWRRLQETIEEIRLPNEGFICITDNPTGALICHPALRKKPEMLRMSPGKAALDTGSQRLPIVELLAARGEGSGWAQMPNGVHLIAARRLARLNVNVMVHQRQSGVQTAIDRIMRPVYAIGLAVALGIAAFTAVVSLLIIRRYEHRLELVNLQLEDKVRQRTRSLEKTRNATIFGLAKLAESRDTDTGDHLDRIREYVVLLAERLKHRFAEIDQQFIEDLSLASSLHDIGKVGVPDAILLKPARLTPDERTIIETHAAIGGECLAEIEMRLGDDGFLAMARNIAFSHHERWDGNGYPNGLSQTQIPLVARIVSVADVYDALTSKRPYKEAMDHQTAFDLIVENAGTQFDPEVVEAFIDQEYEFRRRSEAQQTAQAVECQERQLALSSHG